jgi:hypothetical protein
MTTLDEINKVIGQFKTTYENWTVNVDLPGSVEHLPEFVQVVINDPGGQKYASVAEPRTNEQGDEALYRQVYSLVQRAIAKFHKGLEGTKQLSLYFEIQFDPYKGGDNLTLRSVRTAQEANDRTMKAVVSSPALKCIVQVYIYGNVSLSPSGIEKARTALEGMVRDDLNANPIWLYMVNRGKPLTRVSLAFDQKHSLN